MSHRRLWMALPAIAIILLATRLQLPAQPPTLPGRLAGSGPFVSNEILVSLTPAAARSAQAVNAAGTFGVRALDALGAQLDVQLVGPVFGEQVAGAESHGLDRVFKLRTAPGADLFSVIERYAALPDVEYAEPNRIYRASRLPNDVEFRRQWALHNTGQTGGTSDSDIDAPEAWDLTVGKAITIAVIDTGVDYRHPELKGGRVLTAADRDFVNGDNDALDDHGHGTYVSGIVAAATNNRVGIAGVCWNCKILPIKVLDSEGSGTAEWVAQGIQWAGQRSVKIISMSLGYEAGCGCSKTIARAINYAWDRGAILIAASGNDSNKSEISYPASSSRVLAVGATDHRDREASFSNRAPDLDILAPGDEIYSLDLSSKSPAYREASGTSAATPFVSGTAGLLLGRRPGLKNAQVWSILRTTANPVSGLAAPRLNARAALASTSTTSFAAPVDDCETEPDSCPPGCLAEVALAGDQEFLSQLAVLHSFRAQVLEASPRGRQWSDAYRKHRLEVARLVLTDEAFRSRARTALRLWLPFVAATADPGRPAERATQQRVAAAREILSDLRNRAGAELRADLAAAERDLTPYLLKQGASSTNLRAYLEGSRP